jgi:hypothetical protein
LNGLASVYQMGASKIWPVLNLTWCKSNPQAFGGEGCSRSCRPLMSGRTPAILKTEVHEMMGLKTLLT